VKRDSKSLAYKIVEPGFIVLRDPLRLLLLFVPYLLWVRLLKEWSE